MSFRRPGRAPTRRNRPSSRAGKSEVDEMMQMAFDMLPDSMAADDRLLLASMPAKCMCCPQEATLGAQLMRFIDEAKEGGNMGHCIHWALNLVFNLRTQDREELMAQLLYAGGALPRALWLTQQQLVVTPALAGMIEVPPPPVPPGQLFDAPQDHLLTTTARGVGLELLSQLLTHVGEEFPPDKREAACLAALAALHSSGSIHLERFYAIHIINSAMLTAPDHEVAVLMPWLIERGLFKVLLEYIRDTASAAGICGALQLIANMMIISGTLRETLPSTARGTSSSCCSECGQPSGGEEDNPPWSMEAWLPALADQGVLAVVSQALANVHKLKPYTYAQVSWAHTQKESAKPVAEMVLHNVREGLEFMGYVPGTSGIGSSSSSSSKCTGCFTGTGTAAASTCGADGAAGDSDVKAAAGSKKKKKKKKNKAAKQNGDAGDQQQPVQPEAVTTDDITATRTPLADVTEAGHGANGGGSGSSDKPTQGQAQGVAGDAHGTAAAVDVQPQASQEEGAGQSQQQGGEPRLVLRTKDGKLVRPKQLRNVVHQMQGLGLG